jgi:hypothetical protein
MAKSFYLDKDMQPVDLMVTLLLDDLKPLWIEIIQHAKETYPTFSQKWKYYGSSWGWSLVLKSKTKTLCYLTPAAGYFQVSINFNDEGRRSAAEGNLPEAVAKAIAAMKSKPNNIPYDFEVREASDLVIAEKLIALRANPRII